MRKSPEARRLLSWLDLLGPYLMGRAIDRHIVNRQFHGLAQMAGLMLAVYITNQGLQALSSWTMAGVSQRALKNLRRDQFTHLQDCHSGFSTHTPPVS